MHQYVSLPMHRIWPGIVGAKSMGFYFCILSILQGKCGVREKGVGVGRLWSFISQTNSALLCHLEYGVCSWAVVISPVIS